MLDVTWSCVLAGIWLSAYKIKIPDNFMRLILQDGFKFGHIPLLLLVLLLYIDLRPSQAVKMGNAPV